MVGEQGEYRPPQQPETKERVSQTRAIPVFDRHATLSANRMRELSDRAIQQGRFPESISVWSHFGLQAVRRLRPSIIAVDGVFPESSTERLAYNPGMPFSFRTESPTGKDTFLVGADIRRDLSGISEDALALIKRAQVSTDLLLGDRSNGLADTVKQMVLSFRQRHISFRNALIAAKTIDAEDVLGDRAHDGPLVNLLGNAHMDLSSIIPGLPNVWGNQGQREKVLEREFTRIFRMYQRVHKVDASSSLSENEISQLVYDLIQAFGDTTVWRVKKRPQGETLDVQTAKNALPIENRFYSPTLYRVMLAAASKTLTVNMAGDTRNYSEADFRRSPFFTSVFPPIQR